MKKNLILTGVAIIALIFVFSFKTEETKPQLVTISIETQSIGKIQFYTSEAGVITQTDCKRFEKYQERANLINKYIAQGYTIASTNNYAVVMNGVYEQVENIYLEK